MTVPRRLRVRYALVLAAGFAFFGLALGLSAAYPAEPAAPACGDPGVFCPVTLGQAEYAALRGTLDTGQCVGLHECQMVQNLVVWFNKLEDGAVASAAKAKKDAADAAAKATAEPGK